MYLQKEVGLWKVLLYSRCSVCFPMMVMIVLRIGCSVLYVNASSNVFRFLSGGGYQFSDMEVSFAVLTLIFSFICFMFSSSTFFILKAICWNYTKSKIK